MTAQRSIRNAHEHAMFTQVQNADDLLRVFMIRGIVFMEEQGISWAEEMDEHDFAALHILGEMNGEPIACGRIRFIADRALLQRLAVRRKWRGHGLGAQLLENMVAECTQRGFRNLYLHAQTLSRDFYAKFGFTVCGDEFMEAGIPHVPMRMMTPHT